ncbi:MAG: Mur ligase family protein [Zetaproteobacteria bacterium]|nr:Mur ligase family protein [Zetaproteobacteria bacterium]
MHLGKGARLHFLGIGGSGMLPLAQAALEFGFAVSGTDLSLGPRLDDLRASGAQVVEEAFGADLLCTATHVICSSAIARSHVLLQLALQQGKALLHRSDLLNFFCQQKKTIAVAGTHGKSSTAAMVTYALHQTGRFPSYILGAPLQGGLGAAAWDTRGEWLVIEADESDRTHEKYHPELALVTSVDFDHLDCYGSGQEIVRSFVQFLSQATRSAVVHPQGELGQCVPQEWKMLTRHKPSLKTYGTAEGLMNRVGSLSFQNGGGSGTYQLEGGATQNVELPQLGQHSFLNALGAGLVCQEAGLSWSQYLQCMRTFPGVYRRLQVAAYQQTWVWVDDYAHNPGKIQAAVQAVRQAWPSSRLSVIFEPHRYSRLQTMAEAFFQAFRPANDVYVTEVYAAGEQDEEGVWTAAAIASQIGQYSGVSSQAFSAAVVIDQVRAVDQHCVLLTLGAGGVRELGARLIEQLSCQE